MKRAIVLIVTVLLLSGCVNIAKSDYNEIINEAVSSNKNIYNTYRSGYKFYLPSGLYIENSKDYNEVIKSGDDLYYLYIDIISYLNKKESPYVINEKSLYSDSISHQNKSGYIEINEQKEKYLVEIMYNYAKIEVMVDEKDLKKSVSNAIIILSSIKYNDGILENLTKENVLSYSEENVDIFSTNGKEKSNFLEYVETYDADDEDSVPEYDLIK